MIIRRKIFVILLLFLISCHPQPESDRSYVLMFNPDKSDVKEQKLVDDSIVIQIYSQDSMLFSKYYDGNPLEYRFFASEDGLWEKRYRGNDFGEKLGIDTILTFSKRDTTFLYKSAHEFIVLVQTYSFADCRYDIRKVGNEYVTTKQSLIDTTYKEIYYYDKHYHPYRFISTWKDNVCVYEKK